MDEFKMSQKFQTISAFSELTIKLGNLQLVEYLTYQA